MPNSGQQAISPSFCRVGLCVPLVLMFVGCQEPTQITLHLKTDVAYEPGRNLSFSAANPNEVEDFRARRGGGARMG